MKAYKQKIKEEIITDCTYMIDMLQSYCLDREGNRVESNTFFLLMAADLTRYMCEQNEPGTKLADLKDNALKLYDRSEMKSASLHLCCPTKMSRDLHHANFIYEFKNDTSKAIRICEASVLKC